MKTGVVIAVAVGVAAAAGVFVQQQMRDRPAAVDVQPGSAGNADGSAAALPAEPPSAIHPAPAEVVTPDVPEVLPHVQLADRDGKQRSLKEWAGRPLMVNFWATWCGPCRREIPLLNQLRQQRTGQRLEIVGIAVDFRDDVLAYAKETAIDYPLLIGEEDGLAAVTAMGMQPAFPFTVFADSRQRVVAMKVGELHQDDADLILDRVVAVDAGRLDLAAAREQITEGLKANAIRRAQADKG